MKQQGRHGVSAMRPSIKGDTVHVFSAAHSAATLITSRLRSLVLLAALALSLLVSGHGADAELKSEWKFGGSLAHRLMSSLPIASSVLGDDSVFGVPMLPSSVQPTGGTLDGLFTHRGIIGGFAAGFLGAGVFGLVFGHGIYGELSGAVSVLGLVFQLTLLVMLGWLIRTWWRADKAAALSRLSPRQLADAYGRTRHDVLPQIGSETDEQGTDAAARS